MSIRLTAPWALLVVGKVGSSPCLRWRRCSRAPPSSQDPVRYAHPPRPRPLQGPTHPAPLQVTPGAGGFARAGARRSAQVNKAGSRLSAPAPSRPPVRHPSSGIPQVHGQRLDRAGADAGVARRGLEWQVEEIMVLVWTSRRRRPT
ncbi:hypothetical protein C4D60_Mb00t19960 [Musa balbisiana]|uniref:Secreted protein n=1 Tax=Musa balbisiana TaxID=52838 RepID=A0A4S8I4C1_MUSBA|nr:hypothetical protein C4D60_Mb00t19960 [Musa balbisiana]